MRASTHCQTPGGHNEGPHCQPPLALPDPSGGRNENPGPVLCGTLATRSPPFLCLRFLRAHAHRRIAKLGIAAC